MKKSTYLTPAGREWLKARRAQGASEAEITAELLAHEADATAPPRKPGKRGRRLSTQSRLIDEAALLIVSYRRVALAFRGEDSDRQKLLWSVAREIDQKENRSNPTEASARYQRLKRRTPKNLSRYIGSMWGSSDSWVILASIMHEAQERYRARGFDIGVGEVAELFESVADQIANPSVLKSIGDSGFTGQSVLDQFVTPSLLKERELLQGEFYVKLEEVMATSRAAPEGDEQAAPKALAGVMDALRLKMENKLEPLNRLVKEAAQKGYHCQ